MFSVISILKNKNLRHTEAREAVLQFFSKKKHALSHSDIEQFFGKSYDRVTLYRTLKTFLDSGLIHKVLDDEGGMKYAMCSPECNETAQHKHHHDHVHFKCKNCGETNCLDQIIIPSFNLPKGYSKSEMNLLVQGICASCNITAQ